MFKRLLIIFFGFLTFAACLAYAQPDPQSAEKIEILADGSLEWLRNERKFVAKGNASAEHAGTIIYADMLSADYQEAAGQNFDITLLTAEGKVRIETGKNFVTGERAVYDAGKKTLVITGSNLKLVTPEQTVTASERFVYHTLKGELTAVGNAQVTDGKDTLNADMMSAVLEEQGGRRTLKTAQAKGNVIIRTPAETLYGDKGTYHADRQIAEITGNVRIERGPNVLQGERGRVNLATNVSSLYGGEGSGGRVRGVFFPKSEE